MFFSKIVEFIFSPKFLFIISAMIIFFNFVRKNNNFFDVRGIFKEQFKIFINAKGQLFVFYGVPFLMSFGLVNYKLLNLYIVGNTIVVISIIMSMLFCILSILSTFEKKNTHYITVLNETFNTVIFELILCIIILILLFTVLFVEKIESNFISYFISLSIYYFIFTVLLNTFIIIKRIKILFDNK